MDSAPGGLPRTYIIKRSQHLGYGFVAGFEMPTMVKSVEPNGPSQGRLLAGDLIMAVNGIDVELAPREKIIKMIQLSNEQIEIQVRQPTYEEYLRAKNLADPKFHTLNKSTNNLSNITNQRQPSSLPLHPSPLNRLVTSISQQQQHPSQNNPFENYNGRPETPPVQINSSKSVLKQKQSNGTERNDNSKNYTQTLGRNHRNFGRHSPLPQRCKSSIDRGRNGKSSKNSDDTDNDQPLLKRSNTMRLPKNIPTKYIDIFEVVIKIFFEDDRTTVLNYNQDTTVGAILDTLNSRLTGHSPNTDHLKPYFGLTLTIGDNAEPNSKDPLPKRKLLHILDENDSIVKIGQLPYAPRLRILYRMVYPPSDVSTLYTQNKIAFEYLYRQSCNDLRLERFEPELDQDNALKLCALHLLEYVHSHYSKALGDSKDPKVYIKLIKKDKGIENFLPPSMLEGNVDKKGKIMRCQYKKMKNKLTEQLRKNFEEFNFEPPRVKSTTNLNRYSSTSFHELSLPELQASSSDCIKLQFLSYLSQLSCYGNSKRPIRTSTSPIERNSTEGCSSSLESVPRTSDSSPLIKQTRLTNQDRVNQNQHVSGGNNNLSTVSRLTQMNSMRCLSSVQSSTTGQSLDCQPDLAQTPSEVESISSITINMQNSPSPQQAPPYLKQPSDNYPTMMSRATTINPIEPSPMPRQQINGSKLQDYNSIDKLYGQRYTLNHKPIEDLLKHVILLPPPPPPSSLMYSEMPYQLTASRKKDLNQANYLTQVLTDKDIEKLIVRPPPPLNV